MTLPETTIVKLLTDMRTGCRVTIVSATPVEMRETFKEFQQWVLPPERVRRANGEEEICSWNTTGFIRFLTAARFDSAQRGRSADVIVMPSDVSPNDDLWVLARAALAASSVGEILVSVR